MSAPRYLNHILNQFGQEHFFVVKEIFIAGSLTKSEIERVVLAKYKMEVGNCVTELTLGHYLIGVQSFTAAEQPDKANKKRDQKAKDKKEQEQQTTTTANLEDVPIRINFKRFLAEERKQAVLAMCGKKLVNTTDDLPK